MGPLAVRPDRQGRDWGRRSCGRASTGSKRAGATTIGLETMPRTMDNIGFYSRLGFRPGHLTVTLIRDAARTGARARRSGCPRGGIAARHRGLLPS